MSCERKTLYKATIQVGSRDMTLMVSAIDERKAAKLMVDALDENENIADQADAFGSTDNPYTPELLYDDILKHIDIVDSKNHIGPGAIITNIERARVHHASE